MRNVGSASGRSHCAKTAENAFVGTPGEIHRCAQSGEWAIFVRMRHKIVNLRHRFARKMAFLQQTTETQNALWKQKEQVICRLSARHWNSRPKE